MSWTGTAVSGSESDTGFLPSGGDPGEVLAVGVNGQLEWVSSSSSSERFNILNYGADPTGIVNATPAIQAAIDAAKANNGGAVYIPSGTYKLEGGLDLTGIGNGMVTLAGDSRLGSALMCAFNGGSGLDLAGSTRVLLKNFALNKVPGFMPDQMLLLARPAGDAGGGNHQFENLHIDGTCNNASVVNWGSEVNTWIACDIRSSVDKPAMVCAVKISELGFTPTSSIAGGIGTGSGGVGCNIFTGCIFCNLSGVLQTSPLLRLFGANAWAFYGCYSYCESANTIEINVSSFINPADHQVYYPRITFESFEDEAGPLTASNKRSIYFSPFTAAPEVVSRESCRGIHLRNCALFNIFGADGTIVDNLVFDGGRYSPSFTALAAGHDKLSLYRVINSLIAPSACEKNLDYIVRNGGSNLTVRGVPAAHLSLTGVTSGTIVDDAGKFSVISGWESGMQSGCSIEPGLYGIATIDAFGPAKRLYLAQTTYVTNGQLAVGGAAVPGPAVTIDGAAATGRSLILQTGGLPRWVLQADNTAESGADAGSNLTLFAFNDAGGSPANLITFGRKAGTAIALARPLTIWSMTKAERNALSAPANGMAIYQTDVGNLGLRVRENGVWVKYTSTADA